MECYVLIYSLINQSKESIIKIWWTLTSGKWKISHRMLFSSIMKLFLVFSRHPICFGWYVSNLMDWKIGCHRSARKITWHNNIVFFLLETSGGSIVLATCVQNITIYKRDNDSNQKWQAENPNSVYILLDIGFDGAIQELVGVKNTNEIQL